MLVPVDTKATRTLRILSSFCISIASAIFAILQQNNFDNRYASSEIASVLVLCVLAVAIGTYAATLWLGAYGIFFQRKDYTLDRPVSFQTDSKTTYYSPAASTS